MASPSSRKRSHQTEAELLEQSFPTLHWLQIDSKKCMKCLKKCLNPPVREEGRISYIPSAMVTPLSTKDNPSIEDLHNSEFVNGRCQLKVRMKLPEILQVLQILPGDLPEVLSRTREKFILATDHEEEIPQGAGRQGASPGPQQAVSAPLHPSLLTQSIPTFKAPTSTISTLETQAFPTLDIQAHSRSIRSKVSSEVLFHEKDDQGKLRGHIGQDRLYNFDSQHTQDSFCDQVGQEEYSDQDREEDLICQETLRPIGREDFCDQDRQAPIQNVHKLPCAAQFLDNINYSLDQQDANVISGRTVKKCFVKVPRLLVSRLKQHKVENKEVMDVRMDLKNKGNKCSVCNKRFRQKSSLVRHLVSVHRGVQPHQCEQCEKKFGRKVDLLRHAVTVHQGLKPHQCEQCEKKFGLKQNLLRHLDIVHQGVKPYQCEQCGKKFGQKVSLKSHLSYMHGGDKSFVCNEQECNNRYFVNNNDLLNHLRVKHSHPKLQCGTRGCIASFSWNSDYFKHKKLAHGGDY